MIPPTLLAFVAGVQQGRSRGRIYVDTGRNGYSAMFAATYTVRAKPGALVSAPCTWDEVVRGEVDPQRLTLTNTPERIAKVGDLWGDLRRRARSLKRPTEKLRRIRNSRIRFLGR